MNISKLLRLSTILIAAVLLAGFISCSVPKTVDKESVGSYDELKKLFVNQENFVFPDISPITFENSKMEYLYCRRQRGIPDSPCAFYDVNGLAAINGREVYLHVSAKDSVFETDKIDTEKDVFAYGGAKVIHRVDLNEDEGRYGESLFTYINGVEYVIAGILFDSPSDEVERAELAEVINKAIYQILYSIVDTANSKL